MMCFSPILTSILFKYSLKSSKLITDTKGNTVYTFSVEALRVDGELVGIEMESKIGIMV